MNHNPRPSTGTPTGSPDDRPIDLLATLAAAGVTLDDLAQVGLVRAEETPTRSLSGQVTRALVELERDRPGSHKT